MATSFAKATLTQAKLRLALQGPSGSGKSYSALAIAKGLGGRVVVLDTERGSASKYARVFDFDACAPKNYHPDSFVEVIRDYAADGKRSILLTSHIIQDLEHLIDHVIIYQRGKVLIDMETSRLVAGFRGFSFDTTEAIRDSHDEARHIRLDRGEKRSTLYGFLDAEQARSELHKLQITQVGNFRQDQLSLEDVFIALTGKY